MILSVKNKYRYCLTDVSWMLSLEYRYFKHAGNSTLTLWMIRNAQPVFRVAQKQRFQASAESHSGTSQYPQAGVQDSAISGNLQKDCTEQNMRKLLPLRSECGALTSSHLADMKLICLDRQLHDPGAKRSAGTKGCTAWLNREWKHQMSWYLKEKNGGWKSF